MEESGEINIEKFISLISNYQTLIQQLTAENDFYREEQDNLKIQTTILINENKSLSDKINQLLQLKNDASNEHKYTEKNVIENLQKQLALVVEEKESAMELWNGALKTIDQLEEELKLFEGHVHGYVSKDDYNKTRQKYEAQIQHLEAENKKLQDNLENVIKTSESKIAVKTNELKRMINGQDDTLKIIENLEEEVKKLQCRQMENVSMRNKLENILDNKNKQIDELKMKNEESKAKVCEAVHVIEAAMLEKDAALIRESQAKEETSKISKTLSEILDETSEKVKHEVEIIKTKYEVKVQKILVELKGTKEELEEKNKEIAGYKQQCSQLENQIERFRKGNLEIDDSNINKQLILEKNLESTFQKLLLSERTNLQLTSERDAIKADLEQMGNYYERDIKTREVEKRNLQEKIQTLNEELKICNSSLIKATNKIDELKTKIKVMENDYTKQNEDIWKKYVSEKIKKIKNDYTKQQNGLLKHIENQKTIHNKWKIETKKIIHKLIKRIKLLQNEADDMKDANQQLTCKLAETENIILNYKTKLKAMYDDVNINENFNKINQ